MSKEINFTPQGQWILLTDPSSQRRESGIILDDATAKKLSTKPGKCFFPELGWPTGKINPNTFEIITTGEWHDCDYYDWGKNTTIAIEKGIKECGRYMNWTWTNDRQTEYKCKG